LVVCTLNTVKSDVTSIAYNDKSIFMKNFFMYGQCNNRNIFYFIIFNITSDFDNFLQSCIFTSADVALPLFCYYCKTRLTIFHNCVKLDQTTLLSCCFPFLSQPHPTGKHYCHWWSLLNGRYLFILQLPTAF
jgi:hypothetical protein